MKFENLPTPQYKDTINFYAQSKKEEIGFINFIFDSYEGLGNIRTINENSGLLEFWIAPDFLEVAQKIFKEFEERLTFQIISKAELESRL